MSFQFKYLMEGKKLLSYLDGTSKQPDESASVAQKKTWSTNNAKVFSYLIGSKETKIALTLRTFTYAAEIWEHHQKTYSQFNTSRIFEVEYELAKLTQGELDARSFYLAAQTLWTKQDLISTSTLSPEVSTAVQKERHRSRVLQFLMKLRPEFESIRSQLVSANKTDIDAVLGDLVRAEIRLRTQHVIDDSSTVTGNVFASNRTQYRPQFGQVSNSAELRYRHCNELGHSLCHCKKSIFCNYCKKSGHIIPECRKRKQSGTYNQLSRNSAGGSSSGHPSNSSVKYVPNRSAFSTQSISEKELDFESMVHSTLQKILPSILNNAFSAFNNSGTSSPWLVDFASFNHMSGQPSLFRTCRPVSNLGVQVANGQKLNVVGVGDVDTGSLVLHDTLYVPSLVPNMVYVGQLTDDNCLVSFSPSGCRVQDLSTKRTIGTGRKEGRNFELTSLTSPRDHTKETTHLKSFSSSLFSTTSTNVSDDVVGSNSLISPINNATKHWQLWHARLGYPNNIRLRYMFDQKLLPDNLQFRDVHSSAHTCVHCIGGKASKLTFPLSSTIISEPFRLVHTDLWGPSPVTSRLRYRYFALFVDHATRYTWIYFLRLKSDLLIVAKEFVTMVQTQFNKAIKIIRSNPGGEYTSNALQEFYKIHGIISQQSCPGVSERNGLVERKNRHVLELARALLLQSQVPTLFWPY
ncbi:Retrovirus-related Pol polyprotein from transposon RE1 [Linum grandiflorum]